MGGVILGAVSMAACYRERSVRSNELFTRRLKCNTLAEEYAKRRSGPARTGLVKYSPTMVDYSDSRDSCVGQFDVVYSHPEPLSDESAIYVVDLGTNEVLFDEGCSGDCSDTLGRAQDTMRKYR
jgi:hypothetical protein